MVDSAGKPVRMVGNMTDLTERKLAEAEREEINKQLVEASRWAGMAEVASGVLHNVGNVLNSVNVSCSVISNRIRQSRISSVAKRAELLLEHASDLAQFLTTDSSGRKLPEFLVQLAARLSEEQRAVLDEVQLLGRNIEHIKAIISVQQSHAKNRGGIWEILPIDAVRYEVTLSRRPDYFSSIPAAHPASFPSLVRALRTRASTASNIRLRFLS